MEYFKYGIYSNCSDKMGNISNGSVCSKLFRKSLFEMCIRDSPETLKMEKDAKEQTEMALNRIEAVSYTHLGAFILNIGFR